MKVPYVTKKEMLQIFRDNEIISGYLLLKVLRQVEQTHGKQKRDDGGPYVEQHIYPIVVDLIRYYKIEFPGVKIPEELLMGALLHDILEDDINMSDDIFMKDYGQKIYSIVKPLTKPWHSESMTQDDMMKINKKLFDNVIHSSQYSILIKLADRTNNMESFFAFKKLGFPKFKRYIKEVESDYLPYAKVNNKYFFERLTAVIAELRNIWKQ